jgi:SAM-dependent methyltransferase
MKLNLGSCDREFPGYTSVDICPPADIIADLARPWPWEDSSIDEIRAYDIIEHLPNKQHTMNEAWRVLRPGGRFDIDVPTTDGRGAWQDPTHVSYWNRNSFLYYTAGDAHRERFGRHYGVHARFKVVAEDHTRYPDQVVKLKIVLEAVK